MIKLTNFDAKEMRIASSFDGSSKIIKVDFRNDTGAKALAKQAAKRQGR